MKYKWLDYRICKFNKSNDILWKNKIRVMTSTGLKKEHRASALNE